MEPIRIDRRAFLMLCHVARRNFGQRGGRWIDPEQVKEHMPIHAKVTLQWTFSEGSDPDGRSVILSYWAVPLVGRNTVAALSMYAERLRELTLKPSIPESQGSMGWE